MHIHLQVWGILLVLVVVVVHIGYTVVCLLEGQIAIGLIGLPVPLLGLVGAIRLAKRSSFWARRLCSDKKMASASARFGREHEERLERPRDVVSLNRAPRS